MSHAGTPPAPPAAHYCLLLCMCMCVWGGVVWECVCAYRSGSRCAYGPQVERQSVQTRNVVGTLARYSVAALVVVSLTE